MGNREYRYPVGIPTHSAALSNQQARSVANRSTLGIALIRTLIDENRGLRELMAKKNIWPDYEVSNVGQIEYEDCDRNRDW